MADLNLDQHRSEPAGNGPAASGPAGSDLNLLQFTYTNHRGETETRRVLPIRIWFGSTAWHPNPQWLMEAFDLDKQGTRDFALCGIHGCIKRYIPTR